MKRLWNLKLSNLKEFKKLINNNYRRNLFFFLALIVYIILVILLFNYYQYIINYDGIFYISIAHEYANFDFSNAINGYWSPLLSWLLTPFLLFGSSNIFQIHSAKILSIIIGFLTLIGVKFLFSKFIMDEKVINTVLFAMVPLVLYFVFFTITPDLLLLCILLFYLGLIFDPKYSYKLRNGFSCGFLGALAYFSKTYAFIFFISHFILFNVFFYFHEMDREKRKKVRMNLILGLTVFLALSGIWAGIISEKYNEITIGTSGTVNLAKIGPEYPVDDASVNGLIGPKNNNPVSGLEDPSYNKMNSWNPLGSYKSFYFYLNVIWNNILKTSIILMYFSILSLLILLASLIMIIKYHKNDGSRRKLKYLLITILIYLGGYCLIFVESRYLWPILILIFLLGVYLFEIFFKNGLIKSRTRSVLLVLLIFSFIIMPITGLINNANDEYFALHNVAYTLKDDYNVHGNIASNDFFVDSLVLTYYLNGTYYGQTKTGLDLNGLETELNENNIDYYLVWGSSTQDLPYKEIVNLKFYSGTTFYLKIYSLKNGV